MCTRRQGAAIAAFIAILIGMIFVIEMAMSHNPSTPPPSTFEKEMDKLMKIYNESNEFIAKMAEIDYTALDEFQTGLSEVIKNFAQAEMEMEEYLRDTERKQGASELFDEIRKFNIQIYELLTATQNTLTRQKRTINNSNSTATQIKQLLSEGKFDAALHKIGTVLENISKVKNLWESHYLLWRKSNGDAADLLWTATINRDQVSRSVKQYNEDIASVEEELNVLLNEYRMWNRLSFILRGDVEDIKKNQQKINRLRDFGMKFMKIEEQYNEMMNTLMAWMKAIRVIVELMVDSKDGWMKTKAKWNELQSIVQLQDQKILLERKSRWFFAYYVVRKKENA